MALSIKNAETERLARELARETGEPVTTAVTAALAARLATLRTSSAAREQRAERLRQLTADTAARWGDDSSDPTADLYDERGLPR
jgi:antitoxin VapB